MSEPNYTQHHTTSRDGTSIGYLTRSSGTASGPGIVLIQGAMATCRQYDDLATSLASTFTVHTTDRRGRGLSPKPYDQTHDIARDVEDLEAVLVATASSRVFGLSSGAMIVLEATRTLPPGRIAQAAVYEPPFYPSTPGQELSRKGVQQLNAEVESGDYASALLSALTLSRAGLPILNYIPRPIGRLLTASILYAESWKEKGMSGDTKLVDLVPSVRYDFNDVERMNERGMENLRSIQQPVLLISGTKSAEYLQESVRRLEGILPNAKHVVLEGLDHGGAWNGKGAAMVAQVLKEFFSERSEG